MILENPRGTSPDALARRTWRERLTSPETGRNCVLFLVLFAVVLGLQSLSGAYNSEFAGYPDEPAHYVTSLMVRDFIAQLHWSSPTQFAENYYAHYPKVAFGHWPPLLYVVQAAWMLIFSTTRASVLVELAVLTTLLAFTLYTIVRKSFGWKAGALAALLLVCLPDIQRYTDEVMAETLLILVSLWAVIFFARYLDSHRWQDSLWFGVFTSLAVLTKGNGWELGFVPPVALLLTRRWRLILRPSFWLSALAVLILCVPWQLWSFPMAHRGWTGGDQPNASYTLHAIGAFALILAGFMGPVLTFVAVIGMVATILIPFPRARVQPLWAVMFGLILGVWIFHTLVPAGVESRKMIVAIPALILFLFAGGTWLAGRLPARRWNTALITAVLAAIFALTRFSVPSELHYGFTEAATYVSGRTQGRDLTVLVSSELDGEGLFISELAMHEKHRPVHTVLRGSRSLSSSDWTGASYQSAVHNVTDLEDALTKAGVGIVVVDSYPPRQAFLHHQLIMKAIVRDPYMWRLAGTFQGQPGMPGEVRVYRFSP